MSLLILGVRPRRVKYIKLCEFALPYAASE
jgi:hypothetical protein